MTASQVELLLPCRGRTQTFFCLLVWCVCLCVRPCIPIAIYNRKRHRERKRKRKNWALAILFTASDFDICCLVRGRLNKFKVKQTAAFSHIAARGKITVGKLCSSCSEFKWMWKGPCCTSGENSGPRQTANPSKIQISQRRQGGCRSASACCSANLKRAKLPDVTVWLKADVLKFLH